MTKMTDFLARAGALHAESIVVDGHADTPQRFADEAFDWLSADLRGGQLSAATAQAGGLHGEFLALWAEPAQWAGHFVERTYALLDAVDAQVAQHPQALARCTSAAEVRRARQDGRFAALLGIEGGHSIANDLDLLRDFFARGVRYMTLTWSNTNDWCDSSGDVPRHNGLSAFGQEVLAEMNRLGMLVDVSHVSDAAFWQALEASRAPVIASHSSTRALTDSYRNLTDEMLRAIAAQDGVVMVNFNAAFIDETHRLQWNALHDERIAAEEQMCATWHARGQRMPYRAELELAHTFLDRAPRPPLSSLVDHFEHVLRVCGTEHVGIGSDFDGIPAAPAGMDSAADLPKITAGLLERGWKPHELRGMLGENILRVLDHAHA
ncbi:dipeptidase [Terriglobus sp.]|uniref:dipeptidase n=1 Tax=Terriglobus sp. TaxID=1889013 RepID=UPI003AFF93E4